MPKLIDDLDDQDVLAMQMVRPASPDTANMSEADTIALRV
jgi:hypothetical protein